MLRHLATSFVLIASLASSALAQLDGQILVLDGERINSRFGYAVAAIGDVDADGRGDFVVGAPTFGTSVTISGRVYVFSGGTGALLYSIDSERTVGITPRGTYLEFFGICVAAAGDVDGDGRNDFLVGDPGFPPQGKVYVFSGPDGALIRSIEGEGYELPNDSDQFGSDLDGAGDVDGDGVPDFVVGADGVIPPFGYKRGRAYIVSGATGAYLSTFEGASAGSMMGDAVARAGDIDGDGTPDVIVGSPRFDDGTGRVGRADVFSGRTGEILRSVVGSVSGKPVGTGVAGVGDLDADGYVDFAVTDCRANPFGSFGGVVAFSGRTGGVLWRYDNPGAGSCFSDVVGARDLTGDGIPDVLACDEDKKGEGGEYDLGRVTLCSGNDGHAVASWWGEARISQFGASASSGSDSNGDGRLDFVVGAPYMDWDGTRLGRVYVLSLREVSYIRAREGNVGSAVGTTENVLFVNGLVGSGLERVILVDKDAPFEISMLAPQDSPAGPASYALYAWLGVPGPPTVTSLPFDYGVMCMAPELTGGTPKKTWNCTGDPSFGVADRPSLPAPSIVFARNRGVGKRATFFVQGLIANASSPSGTFGVTNGTLIIAR